MVAGAFSLGLLISAIAAPAVGRLADRGQGPAVMQAGGLLAAGLLIAWVLVPTLAMTYVVWGLLGLCMASILYEPVFAIVGTEPTAPKSRAARARQAEVAKTAAKPAAKTASPKPKKTPKA